MLDLIMATIVSIYHHQTNALFDFKRFFLQFESSPKEECLKLVQQAMQDEDMREYFLHSSELIKILHLLYQAGYDIEFSIPFLLEMLERDERMKRNVYLLLSCIFSTTESPLGIFLVNRVSKVNLYLLSK